jgi:hypothetical protein
MPVYVIPPEYDYRIHHIRPRFKGNVERVLLFLSNEIANLPELQKEDYIKHLDQSIKLFPGNASKKLKTINNWRTEISSLFALVIYNPKNNVMYSGGMARKLAESQDLVQFFKVFLYTFQYPGGHLKPQETKKYIEKNIRFKPAKYILEMLYNVEKSSGKRTYINKAEATYCIFNDLRVTSQGRKPKETMKLIIENRDNKLNYDWAGDKIRYAGDILDYLVYANLLEKNGEKYYLNKSEAETIAAFLRSKHWYSGYDQFYGKSFSAQDLRTAQNEWFNYVNQIAEDVSFETDVMSLIGMKAGAIPAVKVIAPEAITEMLDKVKAAIVVKTKEIGDKGEGLVYGHECMRLKIGKRLELIAKIVCIPNQFSMGYDIRSFELDSQATNRLIEVKTSISNSVIDFNQFHLTDNEWNAAQTHKEKYYVYRLAINRRKITLFIIRDPVGMYKRNLVDIKLSNGAEVKFSAKSGRYEKLLLWKD